MDGNRRMRGRKPALFLMQHEVYKEKAPNVIVDASGKLVSAEIRKGLDEDARKRFWIICIHR